MRGFVYPVRGGNDAGARKTAAHALQIVDENCPGGMVDRTSSRSGYLRALVYPKFISAIKSPTSQTRISSSRRRSPARFPQPGPARRAPEESKRASALPRLREWAPRPELFPDGCI